METHLHLKNFLLNTWARCRDDPLVCFQKLCIMFFWYLVSNVPHFLVILHLHVSVCRLWESPYLFLILEKYFILQCPLFPVPLTIISYNAFHDLRQWHCSYTLASCWNEWISEYFSTPYVCCLKRLLQKHFLLWICRKQAECCPCLECDVFCEGWILKF